MSLPPQSPHDDDNDAATQPPRDHRLDFEFPPVVPRVLSKKSRQVSLLYSKAAKELTSLKQSAIVNQLYGGWTLAVEK